MSATGALAAPAPCGDAAPAGALALGPELTIVHAADARQTLLQALAAHDGDLALDLSGVTDVDSAGVQLLLATRLALHARGHALRLTGTSAAVRDALATFGLTELAAADAA